MSGLNHKVNSKLHECFKALSNPIRFKVYIEILEEACECNLEKDGHIWGNCITEIAKSLDLPQPTVSNHVKELISCGLARTEKVRRQVYVFGTESLADDFMNFAEFMRDEIYGHDKT